MRNPLAFPIQFKILITLLIVVTTVVSLITFTMAGLFHDDKKAYINDLTSVIVRSTAEECTSVLVGYQDRLVTYGRIMTQRGLSSQMKADLLRGFFGDFQALLSVAIYRDGEEIRAVYDQGALENVGLTRDSMLEYRRDHPLPFSELAAGAALVENTTLNDQLPALTMTFRQPSDDDTPSPYVVSALVRADDLMQISARSRVFEIYLVNPAGDLLAHRDAERMAERPRVELDDTQENLNTEYGLSITHEYVKDGEYLIGGFSSLDFGDLVAIAEVPRSTIYLTSRVLLRHLLLIALLLLVGAAVTSLFGSRRITRPVERLLAATREIAKGKFDVQVEVNTRDEIGALATSFNRMATELHDREEALDEAQSQLVQSEKMAAFGQLGAEIAHEVKNPLAGILGCAQLSLRKTKSESPLYRNLKLIEKETKRCKTIVENLLKFARQEKAILEPIEINTVVNDAAAIVNHQLEINKVSLETQLAEDLPQIRGNANQLQQVLMNLLINAQQAMEGEPGTVTLFTCLRPDDQIEVRVQDTGPGMIPEVQKKIFEPFFTTKPGGKGTGLGLSVSFGIVEDHEGEISIESALGEGSTFVLVFPAWHPVEEAEAAPSAKAA